MPNNRRTLRAVCGGAAVVIILVISTAVVGSASAAEPSVVVDRGELISPQLRAGSATPPPPSPGLVVARTWWEFQHNTSQGYQVGRTAGADVVHMCWTHGQDFYGQWATERSARYNSYEVSTARFIQGIGGVPLNVIGYGNRAGSVNLAVDQTNNAHLALYQREDPQHPYTSWHMYFPVPGDPEHVDDELKSIAPNVEELRPRIEVQRFPAAVGAVHMIARGGLDSDPRGRLVYWRYDGAAWAGPVVVDSTTVVGYVIASDPTSDRVTIVLHSAWEPQFHGLQNIAYYESQTGGAGWISGAELGPANKHFITAYSDAGGPEAFGHISTAYDNAGVLHVIWDEQLTAGVGQQDAIRHRDNVSNTVHCVAMGDWPSPQSCGEYNLNLAKMTLGIGDGATPCRGGAERNQDYLYVVYTQFAGPTAAEQADYSARGYYNGELCLAVSSDHGNLWSRPVNLTNTKTPGCNPGPADPVTGIPPRPDSVCRSEHWATIGKIVHDIDIFFISDVDAGSIISGEGTWNLSDAMYLRLPGGTTDDPYICGRLEPLLSSLLLGSPNVCGFHAWGKGQDSTVLAIGNHGNQTLTGSANVAYTNPASPPADWLTVDGLQSLGYSVTPGGTDLHYAIRMDGAGLPSGEYQAELRIVHNDTTRVNPEVVAVTFAVDPCRCHADPKCDGQVDILDVVEVINRAFRGTAAIVDAACPGPPVLDGRTDVDCNGRTDVIDVVRLIDVAFRAADPATTFCRPCA